MIDFELIEGLVIEAVSSDDTSDELFARHGVERDAVSEALAKFFALAVQSTGLIGPEQAWWASLSAAFTLGMRVGLLSVELKDLEGRDAA